jgi:hypothetical protein
MQQRDPRKRVVRTKLAMQIGGMEAQRFNEFVATGVYTCAPKTAAGTPRKFREPDLIALWWFNKMLGEDIKPGRAAYIACRLKTYLEENLGKDGLCPFIRVTFVETTGFSFFKPTEQFAADLLDEDGKPWEAVHFQHGMMIKATNFELAWVRKLIADAIEAWDNEAGDEDE